MPDSPQPQSSKAAVAALSVVVLIVAVAAGYFIAQNNKAQSQITSLTAQLEDAQKTIAELQPLATKAKTLPVTCTIDKHALTAGYDLLTSNRSRESLRFHFTVNGKRQFNTVIDGGRFWVLRGLASGDTVTIESNGYDPKTITIE